MKVAGYAAIFDTPDASGDRIHRRAFKKALLRPAVPLLLEHRLDQRIGRIKIITEDTKGLRVTAVVSCKSAAALVAQGKCLGLSFGYRAKQFTRDKIGRIITEIELIEISIVAKPMHHHAVLDTPMQQPSWWRIFRRNS